MRDWNILAPGKFLVTIPRRTLPMRDWDMLRPPSLKSWPYLVVPYLWEIETEYPTGYQQPQPVVPYLWEIETVEDFHPQVLRREAVVPYLWEIET